MSMKSIASFLFEAMSEKEKEKAEGMSVLDKILSGDDKEDQKAFDDFFKPNGPCIYAFVTDKVKDAIKIGYTDQHPLKRIQQWKDIYGTKDGEVECLGYWSAEEFDDAGERVFFWDHAVHKKVEGKGYMNVKKDEFYKQFISDAVQDPLTLHYSKEFFRKYKNILNGKLPIRDKVELSKELIEDIINQMKLNIKNNTADFKLYKFVNDKTSTERASTNWPTAKGYDDTDLQKDCIDKGVKAIKNGKKNLLMAAVMRFGKTHAAYEIIKKAGLKKVVVVSAKADVRKAWRDDINHKDFYKDFVFIEVLDKYKWDITHYSEEKSRLVTDPTNIYEKDDIFQMYKDKTIILFFTLHDLAGSINEIKEKHKNLFNQEFDLMVVDETHYGSHANTFGKVTGLNKDIESDDTSDIDEEQKNAKEVQDNLNILNIKYKAILQVSGTPYYILASNEMVDKDAEIISKVSYTDMIEARDNWVKEHPHEDRSKSPYFGVPTLHKIGLRLTSDCRKALKKAGKGTSLTELFRTKGNKLIYEDQIKNLMKSIFGDGSGNSLALLKNKAVEGSKTCRHTMMVLPRKASCFAMKKLLSEFIDTSKREINVVVDGGGGKADISDIKTFNDHLLELDDKGINSLTLTVNKWLTGVSLPLIDSMLYLKNASSPQEYDQNIFRLCTRNVKKVENPDEDGGGPKLVNMKDNVYLIDFNLDNMFNMLANSARMKATADGDVSIKNIEKYMEQDINTVPVIAETGDEVLSKMKVINKKDLMKVYAGYNSEKSIADIANDDIELFDDLFRNRKFQQVIYSFDVLRDKSKNIIPGVNDEEGDTDLSISGEGFDKSMTKTINKMIPNNDREAEKQTREKFKTIIKSLLYCNICLDEPYVDIETILKDGKNNEDFKSLLKDFNLDINDLQKIYNVLTTTYRSLLNSILTKISLLAHDAEMNDSEKFMKAVAGLGKISKSEVVTPPEIVNKMIDKLSKEEYEKAESILLVNEKCGEFITEIYKRFGKDIANKCRIVPSSGITYNLTKKCIKSLGLNENVLLNIPDINGNDKFEIEDFLKMDNEEFLNMAMKTYE